MRASPTSYAELGLSPDTERGAVDRAYRALMKVHHPDRGGDPVRAAAINRAYADITRPTTAAPAPPAPDLANAIYERRVTRRRAAASGRVASRRWPWLLVLATFLGVGAWVEWDPLQQATLEFGWRYFPSVMIGQAAEGDSARGTEPSDSVEAPISAITIDRSVAKAQLVLAEGGLISAADASDRCYHRLANQPSFAALDACLALDDAVVLLAGPAAADKRAFGAVALTARQLAAGRAMGADFGAIEDRLDRVRLLTLKSVKPSVEPPTVPPQPRKTP